MNKEKTKVQPDLIQVELSHLNEEIKYIKRTLNTLLERQWLEATKDNKEGFRKSNRNKSKNPETNKEQSIKNNKEQEQKQEKGKGDKKESPKE